MSTHFVQATGKISHVRHHFHYLDDCCSDRLGNSSSKEKAQRVAGDISEYNQRLGTSFPDTIIDSDLILIDRAKKLAIAFDPESKKDLLGAWAKGSGRSPRFLVHSAMAAQVDREQRQQRIFAKRCSFRFLYERPQKTVDKGPDRRQRLWRHFE